MSSYFVFGSPHWLWLLLLLPLLILLRGRFGRPAAVAYSSTGIIAGIGKRRRARPGWPLPGLRLLSLILAVIALARPQLASDTEQLNAEGIDIVLAIDVSLSMVGLDFTVDNRRTTRLEVAKTVIGDFIRRRPHDRIGMVAFAGEAYLVSPLTLNHDWLLQNLERVEVGLVREQGTAIGSAIAMSVNRLRDLEESPSRVVVLLTDGANNAGQLSPLAAAELAETFGIRVYTVAAGADSRVLVPRLDRNYQVIRDPRGEPIPQGYADFPIDEESLQRIAERTGGRAFRALDTAALNRVYAEIDALERTEITLEQFVDFRELFHWPLGLASVFVMLELLLAHTVLRRLP